MTTPAFKKIAAQAHDNLILSPILNLYLYDAKYPDFSVHFTNHGGARKPDGWFHPSTHPLMTERQLYYYLVQPDSWQEEPLEFMGSLSVTFGTAVHGFIQMCLTEAKVLVDSEVYVEEPKTGSRGSMDGVLDISGWGMGGFEFKTSNLRKLERVTDNDVEKFREKWPMYYAQVQEYMRISGLRRFIVLFLGLGYPWTTKEFVIEFDPAFAYQIETKYRRVRDAVQTGVVPLPCCTPRSKEANACPARLSCPVGLM